MSGFTQVKSDPSGVPITNFLVSSTDIVKSIKTPWIFMAQSPIFNPSPTNGQFVQDFVTIPYSLFNLSSASLPSLNYYYAVYPQLYSTSSSISTYQPNHRGILVFNLTNNPNIGTYQIKWGLTYRGNSGGSFFVKFIIMSNSIYQTPISYDNSYSSSNDPIAYRPTPSNSGFISNLSGYSGNDISNYLPIIQYAKVDFTNLSSGNHSGTITINNTYNTNTDYIVLTTVEYNGTSVPFNTDNISQITIYNSSSTQFSYYFYLRNSISQTFRVIFIIFFTN